jgi:hypothetical protein
MMRTDYRQLIRAEIERVREIDRSETIEHVYKMKDGMLALMKEHWDVPSGWPPGELDKVVDQLYRLFEKGGSVIGAFDKDKLT